MPVDFIWDLKKAESNLRKHGISFKTAVLAFTDPLAQSYCERIEHFEERWHTVGQVDGQLLILVVHTVAGIEADETLEIVRIISARHANRKERRIYEHENG